MERYRVEAACDNCGEEWTTNAKSSNKPPSTCKFCGSTKTRAKEVHEVMPQ